MASLTTIKYDLLPALVTATMEVYRQVRSKGRAFPKPAAEFEGGHRQWL